MNNIEFHAFKNSEELSEAVADWTVAYVKEVLRTQQRFTFLLSGGSTPKELYHLLASEKYKSQIDWTRMHIFFGDERVVPFEDDRNNGKMAYDSLLGKVSIPASQVHYIDTGQPPQSSAANYEKLLQEYFDATETTFDLSLLGMGDDGHTLSLFPGTDVLHEKEKWVTSLYLPSQQMHRITLTPAVVNRSARIAFLVTGSTKSKVLRDILAPSPTPNQYPAQLIQPINGELHWFVDQAAYSTGNSKLATGKSGVL